MIINSRLIRCFIVRSPFARYLIAQRLALFVSLVAITCAASFRSDAHTHGAAMQGGARRPTTPARTSTPPARTATPATMQLTPAAVQARDTSFGRTISVQTEPGAFVWLDDIRRGTTDASGALLISFVPPGRHTLRVRRRGFRENTIIISPVRLGTVRVSLQPTTDAAEIAFDEAESLREMATDNTARERALELYNRAATLRTRAVAAHIGAARTLLDLARYDDALDEIDRARRLRAVFPEASAVEGRILRAQGDTDGAVAAFERAIREARGRQPEAHTGLGLIYEEQGDHLKAAASFRRALAQLQDSEPVIYQLLGSAYEQAEKYREAVAAYERYLALAPNGKLAPAIRSVIEQLRRQAAGENTLPY